MLNLNDLYVFVQVVDHGGFAAAGRALAVPKSTLSKRVAALERELGVRLIDRSSRRFVVTDVGADFHRHASAMLIEAEAAETVVKGRLAEPTGTVRITASVPTTQLLLAELLPGLARAYPKIQIVLHTTDRFVDIVQEGFDIAVRDHFGPLPDSDLVQRRVGFEPNYLVAAPAYLDGVGKPAHPDELADYDGLLTSSTATAWRLHHENGERADAHPRVRFVADEASTLLHAAAEGLGITTLPRKLCRTGLADGSLERVLPAWTEGGVTTTLLMPYRRGQLPAVRVVVDFLAGAIAADPDLRAGAG